MSTPEEIEAAMPPPQAASPMAPVTAAAPAPTRMVLEALKSSLGVTTEDLERRMLAKLSQAARDGQARDDRTSAAVAKREAARAALEPRIAPRLLAAIRKHNTPCALFLGPTGCGKTSAARWVMAAHACHLVRARDLATAARRHGLGDGYPPEVERARERGLLVIDDVGSEGSEVSALQDILDHRYSWCYPTVVTTGLTASGLKALLGAAHYRRIVDQHVLRPDGSEFPVLIVDCHEAGAS